MKTTLAIVPASLLLTALAWPVTLSAQEAETQTNIGFRVGAAYTDNLRRDQTEEGSLFGIAGVDLGIRRSSPRTNINVNGRLERYFYESNLVGDENTGSISAGLEYLLVPQVLHWQFSNTFGQVRRDLFRAAGPGNRENLNVFSTGPDLIVPLGRRMRATFSGRYEDRRYFESDILDSNAWSGQAGLSRVLSPVDEAGIGVSARRIEYDGAFTDPIDIYSAFGTYNRQMANGNVSVQAGVNALDFLDETRMGVLLRFDATRELTARSTITVRGRREFQDASDFFRARQRPIEDRLLDPVDPDRFDDTGELGLTANPLVRTSLSANYQLQRPRATLNFGGSLGDENYENERQRNRRTLNLTGSVSWPFSQLLVGRLSGDYRLESFRSLDLRGHDLRIAATLDRQLGRQLDLAVTYQYGRRLSGRGIEYAENRIMAVLRYTPTGF
jgi:hypothetical protein